MHHRAFHLLRPLLCASMVLIAASSASGCAFDEAVEGDGDSMASALVGNGANVTATKGSATVLAPGKTLTLDTTVTATRNLKDISLGYQVFDSKDIEVGKVYTRVQALSSGQQYPHKWSFTLPANALLGNYRVQTTVFQNSGWVKLVGDAQAFKFQVQAGGGSSPPPPPPPPSTPKSGTAKLVWAEEFNSFSLYGASNPNGTWRASMPYMNGPAGNADSHPGWPDFNSKNTWYINPLNPATKNDSPFSTGNGNLSIACKRTPSRLLGAVENHEWITGYLQSYPYYGANRGEFKYGYFEASIRFPRGRGVFPAFWLYSSRGSAEPKPTAEIDIVEIFGDNTRFTTTIHPSRETVTLSGDLADTYHRFALDWQPTYLRFYKDGVMYKEITGANATYYDVPMTIILNFAMDGNWFPAKSDSSTPSAMSMNVDYVRVYNKKP